MVVGWGEEAGQAQGQGRSEKATEDQREHKGREGM